MLNEATLEISGTFFREAIRLPIQIAALHLDILPEWRVAPAPGRCHFVWSTPDG